MGTASTDATPRLLRRSKRVSEREATSSSTTVVPAVAVTTITLAAITNTLVKLVLAYVLGTREFGNKMAVIFLPTVVVGLVALFLL